MSWLWALEGWQFIAGTLVCVTGSVGLFIGGVAAIAKTIADAATHNRSTCECGQCQNIRDRAWERENSKRRINDPQSRFDWQKSHKPKYGPWLTTRELQTEMLLVSEKGKIYRVEEIQFREYGVALNLKNMVTNKLAWVTIHNDRLDVKLWRSARSEGEGNGNG